MFIGLGSLINFATIILGASLGVVFGSRIKEHARELIMVSLGLITTLAAADMLKVIWSPEYKNALPKGWSIISILVTMIIGVLIGSKLHIEEKLEAIGIRLKRTFDKNGQSPFVEGFVMASLLFVTGPMAILGGISDGMRAGIQTLVLKSVLDGIASMIFASTMGWGIAASAIPTALYQLAWTAVGWSLGNVLADYQIASITATGGLLILSIGLRLLKIKTIPLGDLVPALFVAPIVVMALHQFVN